MIESLKKIRALVNRRLFPAYEFPAEPRSAVFGFDRGTPIDRVYIDAFLMQHREHVRGQCLEIGGSEYSERLGIAPDAISVLGAAPDGRGRYVQGDLSDAVTLPAERFDTFICTQTLNFIFDFPKALENAARMLVPGGCFVGTVAGVSQVSIYDAERWGDFYRFTPVAIERHLAKYFSRVNVEAYGNHYALMNYLTGHAYEDLKSPEAIWRKDERFPMLVGFVAFKSTSA